MLGFTKNFHFLVESENILHNCNIILNLRKIVEPKHNNIFDKKSNICTIILIVQKKITKIFDKNGTVYMIILNIFPKFLLNQHFNSDILGIIH